MAAKNKKTAAIGAICAVAAIIFALVIFVVVIFSESLFPYEKEVDDGAVFRSMNVNVVWNEDKTANVTEVLDVEFLRSEKHGIYVDVPVNSGEKVRNVNVVTSPELPFTLDHESFNRIVRIKIGSENKTFSSGAKLQCKITYDYIIPAYKADADVLPFMAIGQGWRCDTNSAVVTMTYPAAPLEAGSEYGVWIGGDKAAGARATSWSDDGKTVTIKAGDLKAYEGVEIAYKLPAGTLKNNHEADYLPALIGGLLLVGIVAAAKFLLVKNKPLSPIVDFYPPRVGGADRDDYFDSPDKHKLKIRRMLPVQMGKIIDDNCSGEDVTSLIFYWASNGFISIDDRNGETYLIKLHDLDEIAPYELRLFNKLFARATTNSEGRREVAISTLSGSFAPAINECKSAVNSEYKDKFYVKKFRVLSIALSVICALFGIGVAVLSTLRIGVMFNLPGVLAGIPPLAAAIMGTYIAKNHYKLEPKKRTGLLVGYGILVFALAFASSLFIPKDSMGWAGCILFAITLGAASALCPFMFVRTPEYDEQLNAILGFRSFLRDAEKDRLETLIEQDPQYFYDILPYANVLGVSDVWENKFKDMTLEPPTYYHSYSGNMFTYIVIRDLTYSMSKSLTFVPPSSRGSLSGGGHFGGGGGGGFSGGSFGGGGGGSW